MSCSNRSSDVLLSCHIETITSHGAVLTCNSYTHVYMYSCCHTCCSMCAILLQHVCCRVAACVLS